MRRPDDLARTGFDLAPDATLVLADRVILRANRRVEAVFGWTPAELEGQSIRMLYPGQTDFDLIGDRARENVESDAATSAEVKMPGDEVKTGGAPLEELGVQPVSPSSKDENAETPVKVRGITCSTGLRL